MRTSIVVGTDGTVRGVADDGGRQRVKWSVTLPAGCQKRETTLRIDMHTFRLLKLWRNLCGIRARTLWGCRDVSVPPVSRTCCLCYMFIRSGGAPRCFVSAVLENMTLSSPNLIGRRPPSAAAGPETRPRFQTARRTTPIHTFLPPHTSSNIPDRMRNRSVYTWEPRPCLSLFYDL